MKTQDGHYVSLVESQENRCASMDSEPVGYELTGLGHLALRPVRDGRLCDNGCQFPAFRHGRCWRCVQARRQVLRLGRQLRARGL